MKKILPFVLFLVIISCAPQNVTFQDAHNITDEKWQINDYQKFEVEIPESNSYDVEVNIRHTTDYEYANLWCFMIVSDSAQHIVHRDTLNFKLAAEDGRWLGEGYSLININQKLKEKITLKSGSYSFEIQQGMRTNILSGIKNVGLTIQTESK